MGLSATGKKASKTDRAKPAITWLGGTVTQGKKASETDRTRPAITWLRGSVRQFCNRRFTESFLMYKVIHDV
ncbi:hypothetical protein J6590_102402 [Homalodisca vitripennis]|nr:hypothetical protein J6590_102402 [Homalodisca vitripennis]